MSRALDIRNVPVEIRAAVNAEAKRRDMSVSDMLLTALGGYFGVGVQLSGYRWQGTEGSTQWNIRMPDELYAAIRANATDGRTLVGCALHAVGLRYGIEHSPLRRTPERLSPMVVADLRRRHFQDGETIKSLASEVGVKRQTLSRILRAA